MPSSDARRSLLGDSASESDSSVRSGLSAASPSNCGGGAGCSGCVPRLAIRVAIGGEGEDDEDDDLDSLDDKSRRRQRVHGRAVLHAGGGFSFRQDREGGGKVRKGKGSGAFSCASRPLSFFPAHPRVSFFSSLSTSFSPPPPEKPTSRQPRPSATFNPFARCFSWLCGGGGGEKGQLNFSYEVEASDLVGALQVAVAPPSREARARGASSSGSASSSSPSCSFSAFAPFSVSRGCLPPLCPILSSSPLSAPQPGSSSSPRSTTTTATTTATERSRGKRKPRLSAARCSPRRRLPPLLCCPASFPFLSPARASPRRQPSPPGAAPRTSS